MLSAISAVIPAEPLLGNSFMAFHGGFTPWENLESFFSPFEFDHQPPKSSPKEVDNKPDSYLNQNMTCFDKSSPDDDDDPNQNSSNSNSIISGSGSDDPNRNSSGSKSGSGSDDPDVTERKRKRMVSNRESARRSRMRKQRHLENLRNQVNRIKTENRELLNRLRFATYHIHLLRGDSDRLRTEYVILQRRLMELGRISQLQLLQQNYSSSTYPMHGHAIFNRGQITPLL